MKSISAGLPGITLMVVLWGVIFCPLALLPRSFDLGGSDCLVSGSSLVLVHSAAFFMQPFDRPCTEIREQYLKWENFTLKLDSNGSLPPKGSELGAKGA